ncbi:MAG: deoxyguanosinetriphosphate triphosphohydrolase, partial [Clostridia bacterium]|nr:deoxyguanosinetriphosphate triphosphohydrolase [Clostridia bacterium]
VYEHANKLIQESAERMLRQLYLYFNENPDRLPAQYLQTAETDAPRATCDYLSSMTDKYAIGVFRQLFVPREACV